MDKLIKEIEDIISAHQLTMKSDVVKRTNSEEYINSYIDGLELSLHIVKRHLTSRRSRAADTCGCKSATRIQCAFWDGEGGCIHPPPA